VSDLGVILLVEDREDDVLLIKRAFEKIGLANPVQVARDGQEAVEYLLGEAAFSNREEHPLPSLILLDLKMPRMNGFEFLVWIKKQDEFRHLPVVVLSSSSELRDVNVAYRLGANSFLVKPNDFEQFIGLNKSLQEFWLRYGKTPEATRPPRTNKMKAE
jgi:CheY-like chemotaxis protein